MGACNNKLDQIKSPNQSPIKQPIKHMSTQQKLMPKPSRVIDEDYKQIPNKFRRLNTKQKIISIANIDIEIQGLVGLTNLGNTCYLNSSIQSLSNSQPLADYFISQLHTKELNPDNPLSSQGQITNEFANLIRHLWQRGISEEQLVLRPNSVISTIEKFNPIFGQGSQEDAHEFLAYLLDMIHEDLNRIKKKPYVEVTTYNHFPTGEDARNAWCGYLTRNQSIIVDLFQGQMLNSLQCQSCKTARYQFEPFMYLSVPIPSETCSLLDCIQEFMKKEILTGEESWNCPQCQRPRDAVKKIDLWTMPNLLIIHLKRFKFTTTQRCKIRTLVKYPLNDLNFDNIMCSQQNTKSSYDLYAVINHSGTLSSGHYTTHAKNRDTLQWYHYNDAIVRQVDSEQVVSSDGYLLFYYKNSVQEFKRQTIEGIKVSQRRMTLKNTMVIRQTMQHIPSNSNISSQIKPKRSSISIEKNDDKRRITRKQTKHFQKQPLERVDSGYSELSD